MDVLDDADGGTEESDGDAVKSMGPSLEKMNQHPRTH